MKTEIRVPALRDVHPDYAKACDRYVALQLAIQQSDRRIDDLMARKGPDSEKEGEASVAAALADPLAGSIADLADTAQKIEGALAKEHRRLRRLRLALPLARQRRDRELFAASAIVCEQLRPAHRQVIADIAAALVALGHALEAEKNFRESLKMADIAFASNLRPMPVTGVGTPSDDAPRLADWLLEAVRFGLIDASTVPAEWRRRWQWGDLLKKVG